MLRFLAASVTVLASILTAVAAIACASLDGNGKAPLLKTRKPVLGDEVRLGTSFGLRNDPILNIRRMHAGLAWLARQGTPVVAASGGRVLSAKMMDEYGNAILIDHGGGLQTLYWHLERLDVKEGDCIEPLAVIGRVGTTGLVVGPRLYFEVRQDGQAINPFSLPVQDNP